MQVNAQLKEKRIYLLSFNALKEELKNAALSAIDESKPFTVECDASDVAVSASLNINKLHSISL